MSRFILVQMDVDKVRKSDTSLPTRMPTLTETLMELINSSDLSLKEIAQRAGVPYQNFRRWVKGRRGNSVGRSNRTLDAEQADAIYKTLKGTSYVEDTL